MLDTLFQDLDPEAIFFFSAMDSFSLNIWTPSQNNIFINS